MSLHPDSAAWAAIQSADRARVADALSAWATVSRKEDVLRAALSTPHERGTALRLMILLPDAIKQAVFDTLIDLASVGHADIGLCRAVIKSLPRAWLIEHVEAAAEPILRRGEDEEAYRRLAELYCDIDEGLVHRLVQRAARSSNAFVREVADDFGAR